MYSPKRVYPGDLAEVYIHVRKEDAQQMAILMGALKQNYYCRELNGARNIAQRIFAVWPSEYRGSINVALVEATIDDLELIREIASVDETGLVQGNLEIPDHAWRNPDWQLVH